MNEQYIAPHTAISELIDQLQQPQPMVIALEGGPCGGKTTIVSKLVEASTEERPVVVLPEAATEHIAKLQAAGITIGDLIASDYEGYMAFEADIIGTIVSNIESAKREWQGSNALIVADRSDIGAYLSAEDYQIVLGKIGRDRPPHLDLVDKMIYLPSLAREDAGRYTELLSGNTSRYETADQAIATCQRNLGAVAMHPELSIYWGGNFESKVQRVVHEVTHPEHEVEAKYTLNEGLLDYDLVPVLLRGATEARLGAMALTQSYHEWDEQEFRLRHIQTEAGQSLYRYAIKTGSGDNRQELPRILTEEQYNLLRQAPMIGELQKIRERYLFELSGDRAGEQTVLSADYYPASQQCFVELEGISNAEAVNYPIPGFNWGGVSARELVQ